ncbi:MAG: hypothetical protein FD164_1940 [Nitrospirae bacterium]|nr:MAG: hypothetical protein FD164_1940 [Nitrospirota bacterium]
MITIRLLKKSLFGSAGSISGDVLTWIAPSFTILEPLRESFLAVHFAPRVFQHPANDLLHVIYMELW